MNWTKVMIAGVVTGIVLWLVDYAAHGFIMAETYAKYPVFTQEQANPMMFLLISICLTLTATVIYAKTKDCWGDGAKGGITFGLLLGLFSSFPHFYNSLIFEGFPYFLSWCWTGINVIGMIIVGVIITVIYK